MGGYGTTVECRAEQEPEANLAETNEMKREAGSLKKKGRNTRRGVVVLKMIVAGALSSELSRDARRLEATEAAGAVND